MKKQGFFIILLLLLLFSFTVISGCDYITGAVLESPIASPIIVVDITPEEANNLLMDSSHPTYFIDVRTPAEYTEGHISSAINIDFSAADFKENISKLDKKARYVVYCRSGVRSAAASQVMLYFGFKNISNMTGGYMEWVAEGLPVVK